MLILLLFQLLVPSDDSLQLELEAVRRELSSHHPTQALTRGQKLLAEVATLVVSSEANATDSSLKRTLGETHALIGMALREMGDESSASTHLALAVDSLRSLEIDKETLLRFELELAESYINLGVPETAASILRVSQGRLGSDGEEDGVPIPLRIRLERCKGILAAARGFVDQAREQWEITRRRARDAGLIGEQARLLLDLADLAVRGGRSAEARELYEEVIALEGANPLVLAPLPDEDRVVGPRLAALQTAASILIADQARTQALEITEDAVWCAIDAGLVSRASDILDEFPIPAEGESEYLSKILPLLVQAEGPRRAGLLDEALFLIQSPDVVSQVAHAFLPRWSLLEARALKDVGRAEEAVASYIRAFNLIQRDLETSGDARSTLPSLRKIAFETVRACLSGDSVTTDVGLVAQAFQVLEGARLAELDRDTLGRWLSPSATPHADFLHRWSTWCSSWRESKRRWLLGRLGELDPERLLVITQELDRARRDLSSECRRYPTYCWMLGREVPTFREVRQVLGDVRSAYIAVYVGEADSYVLGATRDRQVLARIPGERRLHGLSRAIFEVCQKPVLEEQDREVLREGYRVLLEPLFGEIPSLVERLFVAAEGPVLAVPFEALIRKRARATERYLGQDHEILYGDGSSELLYFKHHLAPRSKERQGLVAIGRGLEDDQETALATSTPERDLGPSVFPSSLYADGPVDRVYIDEQVSRGDFESALTLPRVLVQVDEAMIDSHREDLSRLEIDADLVVWLSKHEGETPPSSALLLSGAGATLMNRWLPKTSLADAYMSRVYGALEKGLTVGAALRVARAEMIAKGQEHAAPSSWAWLRPTGGMLSRAPLERPSQSMKFFGIFFGLLATLLAALALAAHIVLRRWRSSPVLAQDAHVPQRPDDTP